MRQIIPTQFAISGSLLYLEEDIINQNFKLVNKFTYNKLIKLDDIYYNDFYITENIYIKVIKYTNDILELNVLDNYYNFYKFDKYNKKVKIRFILTDKLTYNIELYRNKYIDYLTLDTNKSNNISKQKTKSDSIYYDLLTQVKSIKSNVDYEIIMT